MAGRKKQRNLTNKEVKKRLEKATLIILDFLWNDSIWKTPWFTEDKKIKK